MVLNDLGTKLIFSLRKLSETKTIDENYFKEFMANIVKSLQGADVSLNIALDFAKRVGQRVNIKNIPQGMSPRHIIEKAVYEELIVLLNPGRQAFQPVQRQCNIIMMVGLQGSGKTTTCTKLGSYYKKRSWKTGIVAADTFRAGAREQLMDNCHRANIPYFVDFTEDDPVENAKKGVQKFRDEKYEIIIIDTSGRHSQSDQLFEEMTMIEDAVEPDDIILVIDGAIGQAAHAQALAFKDAVRIGSIICTKLDSTAKGGGAISAIAATGAPISFFGTGENFYDLEYFDPKSFVNRLLGLGDGGTIARKMEEIDPSITEAISEHVKHGIYTFQDMYTQYKLLLGLGSMGSLIESMAPSIGIGGGVSRQQTDASQVHAKRILTVIDSMTEYEMLHPEVFRDDMRVGRLIEGSGLHPRIVYQVLKEHKKWETIIRKMDQKTRLVFTKNEVPTFANERQFREFMQNVAKAMDKETLQSFGGIEGLANVLRSSWKAKEEQQKAARK